MATRGEISAWVNPSAWDDENEAQRVIDAIVESGSDDEADWVRIAGGGADDELAAAARESARASEAADAAWGRLRVAVVAAVVGGMSKSAARRATGVSRPTIDKWLAASEGGPR